MLGLIKYSLAFWFGMLLNKAVNFFNWLLIVIGLAFWLLVLAVVKANVI